MTIGRLTVDRRIVRSISMVRRADRLGNLAPSAALP
jgi:hypothetical protein